MRKIIDDAETGNLDVKLQVLRVNNLAKKFYEKLGFKVHAENENHFKMIYRNNNNSQ